MEKGLTLSNEEDLLAQQLQNSPSCRGLDFLDTSAFSGLSRDSSIIVRRGSEDRVRVKKCYAETIEIALLTLNFDKQNKKNSISSEGLTSDFEDQLLKYNNNKLLIPGVSEFFKDDFTKFWRFPGETISLETSVQLHIFSIKDTIPVKVILTNYRLLFVPSDRNYTTTQNLRSDYFSIPLGTIKHFYKGMEKKNQTPNTLYLSTKYGQKFRLTFGYDSTFEISFLRETFGKIIPFINIASYFAFTFHSEYPYLEKNMSGWGIYDLEKEFTRQGLIFDSDMEASDVSLNGERTAFHKITNHSSNDSNWICDTYPEEVIVPKLITTEELIKASKFRTKNRFPALVYCHNKPNARHFATLWRSSQCKHGLGFYNHRSDEDEMLLRLMGKPLSKENQKEGEINVHIYDARPFLNAVANKMNGKGYENTNYYTNTEIFFLQIDNIHVVRDNYKKLIHLTADMSAEKIVSNNDHNGWLIAISLILSGAKTIIEKSLKKGVNVLVHCSDGWDRTTQLVSLVQLMLDPYFRTIEGFQVLIEKDWISFGHMFKTRNGWKSTNSFEEDKRSPVFIQFLDCVHQLLSQFPYEFEFNLKYLTDLAYYSRTGLFGNFLCDNIAEMLENQVKEKTTSIWSFMNYHKAMYVSCLTNGLGEHVNLFKKQIIPDVNFINLRFWKEFFCFNNLLPLEKTESNNLEINGKDDIYEVALRFQLDKNDQLKKENEILLQKIKELMTNQKDHQENKVQKDENGFLLVEEGERILKKHSSIDVVL